MNKHYYKMSTTKPLSKESSIGFFEKWICGKQDYEGKEAYSCEDGSIMIFHETAENDLVYVEFHGNIKALPEKKGVEFSGLQQFVKFCSQNESNIKLLRNNSIIPPSFGALFSDLKWSKPFKEAQHAAEHPKNV